MHPRAGPFTGPDLGPRTEANRASQPRTDSDHQLALEQHIPRLPRARQRVPRHRRPLQRLTLRGDSDKEPSRGQRKRRPHPASAPAARHAAPPTTRPSRSRRPGGKPPRRHCRRTPAPHGRQTPAPHGRHGWRENNLRRNEARAVSSLPQGQTPGHGKRARTPGGPSAVRQAAHRRSGSSRPTRHRRSPTGRQTPRLRKQARGR